MRKQESFTPSDENLIPDILEIADREHRSKSEMIDILLHLAVKEKNRKRHGKKVHSQHNASNIHSNNFE